ncbi:hypothetical protein TRFO_41169 [Tritrichomonas foetus]|uniref:Peptidase M60 domain-containing protein n=1 Tax=Tritrichomonas foetus TaxID=1144522 RepID=A0A1J4L5N4_9EUKA|nr:hypothetical protein TRFO_41169 [Tritrichomonas foetus]|eukprot:OHT17261.1 hypothetical protein TRFO_41169 [Tritrichomonas foetus]
MGCVQTAPKPRQIKQVNNFFDDEFSANGTFIYKEPVEQEIDYKAIVDAMWPEIIRGIEAIPRPTRCSPVLCLKENVTPLVLSTLHLRTGEGTKLKLPVAVFGIYQSSKYVVVGHVTILSMCSSRSDYLAFLENITRACGGYGRASYRVLILDMPKPVATALQSNMKSFDVRAEISNTISLDAKYHVIFTTTNSPHAATLLKLLESGVGLVLGYEDPITDADLKVAQNLIKNGGPGVGQNVSSASGRSITNSTINSPQNSTLNSFRTGSQLNLNSGLPSTGQTSSRTINTNSHSIQTSFQNIPYDSTSSNHGINESSHSMKRQASNRLVPVPEEPLTNRQVEVYKMKKLIELLGVGFPNSSFVVGSPDSTSFSLKFQRPTEFKLEGISKQFIALSKDLTTKAQNNKGKINFTTPILEDIDALVTLLRLHVSCLKDGRYYDEAKTLWDTIWHFLDSTGVEANNMMINIQLAHNIVFVLVEEVINKVPPSLFKGVDRSLPFPGNCSNTNLEDFALQAEFVCEMWHGTGLYIPPGTVAIVELNGKPIKGLYIQIGSHTERLVSHGDTLKRWSIITNRISVKSKKIKIASPFGGIIYIVAENIEIPLLGDTTSIDHSMYLSDQNTDISVENREDENPADNDNNQIDNNLDDASDGENESSTDKNFVISDSDGGNSESKTQNNGFIPIDLTNAEEEDDEILFNDGTLTIKATFRGVQRYSFFSVNDGGASWEATKELDAPMAEIETNFLIVTLRKKCLKNIDVSKFANFIDILLSKLLKFTVDESLRLFRLVFDVDLNENRPVCGYPIVMSEDMIQGVMQTDGQPSGELFLLLRFIASQSLPNVGWNPTIIDTISYIATVHAFKEMWPAVDPVTFSMEAMSPLFNVLHVIYKTNNVNLFPEAISIVRNVVSEYEERGIEEIPQLWKIFAKTLCQIAKKDYLRDLNIAVKKQNEDSGPNIMNMVLSSKSLNEYQLDDETANSGQIA